MRGYIDCNQSGECFAKEPSKKDGRQLCTILQEQYPKGECAYQKPCRYITDGKQYSTPGSGMYAGDCKYKDLPVNRPESQWADEWDATVDKLRRRKTTR